MVRSNAQKKSQKKYYSKNKDKYNINSYRSKAKNFILKYASKDELVWLRKMIDERLFNEKN
jgi:hypothetical protein